MTSSPGACHNQERWTARRAGALLLMAWLLAGLTAWALPAHAQRADDWSALAQQDPGERLETTLLLMALGFYKDKLGLAGPAAAQGLRSFQRARGLPQTGAPDPRTLAALRVEGAPILAYFGFKTIQHPHNGAQLAYPANLLDHVTQTRRGYLFESRGGDVSLEFSFVPAEQSSLEDLYRRLTQAGSDRRVIYKTIEGHFLVITGTTKTHGYLTQYYAAPGGSVGFTLTFNPLRVRHGDRMALITGGLFQPQGAPGQPETADNAPPPPGGVPPRPPAAPPSQPAPQQARIQTGSGFFVTASGMGITNHHVIEGCSTLDVATHGEAEIVATDRNNDLALIRLKAQKATKPVLVRRSPPRLGEAIFAMGFPLAGALDNGLNFTAGVVSSLAGAENDARILQFTAPIQPGNSGGPLVDQTGALIGVVRAKLNDIATLKAIGSMPQNVNFGIKTDMLASFLAANQAEPEMAAPDRRDLPTADIAALGRETTFQVRCVAAPPIQARR
jgi:serine protease Do